MKKITALLAIFAFIFAPVTPAFASAYTTSGAGNWNTDASWGGGGDPTATGDTEQINHQVEITGASAGGDATFNAADTGNILFSASSTLTLDDSGGAASGTISSTAAASSGPRIQMDAGVTATVNANINLAAGDYIGWTAGGAGGANVLNFGGDYLNASLDVSNTGAATLNFVNTTDTVTTSLAGC